ncbi:MAG TPA: Stp1/IreP family PP2C-type Ser/Thr phosphatase [Actinomycetota bacterium]|nr:Stp1/IreP family PP2C-type Ser/Thr phosphatase [Actinomycetota bacterium]
MKVDVGSATDIGRVREKNEDSLLVHPPLYVVADGMGGHRGGDVASRIAVETMERLADEGSDPLAEHVRRANRAVWDRSIEDQRLSGMGTTLTAARIDGTSADLAHVGDSRAYLMRDGALRQLTDDHSLVARMVKAGEITEAEAEVHPHRNVMTRALGTEEDVEVDVETLALEHGDRLLLCSDGLTGMVTEDQIQAILEHSDGAQQAADRLVKAANRAGGVDNISVVVLEAIGEGDEAAAPGRRVAAPSPRTVARWGLRAGLVLLILLALLFAGRWWLDRQWYVAASDGSVALHQGIPLTILGFELGHPVQSYADLPAAEVRELETAGGFDEGIAVEDREDGEELVEQLREDLREARRAEREAQEDAAGGSP